MARHVIVRYRVRPGDTELVRAVVPRLSPSSRW